VRSILGVLQAGSSSLEFDFSRNYTQTLPFLAQIEKHSCSRVDFYLPIKGWQCMLWCRNIPIFLNSAGANALPIKAYFAHGL
jgi:hypothetical protein